MCCSCLHILDKNYFVIFFYMLLIFREIIYSKEILVENLGEHLSSKLFDLDPMFNTNTIRHTNLSFLCVGIIVIQHIFI